MNTTGQNGTPSSASSSDCSGGVNRSGQISCNVFRPKVVGNLQPQLSNLADDPEELHDLGTTPKHKVIRQQLEVELRSICDPEAVDAMAKAGQMAIVNANGGIEAVVAKGGFGATPPPEGNAEFMNQKLQI